MEREANSGITSSWELWARNRIAELEAQLATAQRENELRRLEVETNKAGIAKAIGVLQAFIRVGAAGAGAKARASEEVG